MAALKSNLSLESAPPSVDVLVDTGHPLVNRLIDGFIKAAGVGAAHAASQDVSKMILRGDSNKKSVENMVQRMGKEAVQWGLVTGVYTGITYGMQEARGRHDWKNALLGGALTGAALSLTESKSSHDRIIHNAITGGAIATAIEFLRSLS